jgi:large subunit ribosomal protein L22
MAATQVAARAFQRSTRQSPYKMRLVVDEIRGKMVNEALAYLQFSKKHAALQIAKTLRSAVANAEHASREGSRAVDVDALYIARIVVNEGPKLKRFTPAAMGRATPIQKRTSHIEIELAEKKVPVKKAPPAAKTGVKSASKPAAKKAAKTGRKS